MKSTAIITVLALSVAACGESTAPAPLPVYGEYSAAAAAGVTASRGALVFTTEQGAVATDWLARGATITLALNADNTTVGRLVIPGLDSDGNMNDGARFEADLAGTWSERGGVLTLQHDSDTFLRDMTFRIRGSQLDGERTFGAHRVRVVLERSSH